MARNAIKHYSQLTPGEQVVLVTGCCGTFGKAACPELLKSFRAVRGYDSMECPDALKLLPGFEFIRGRCEDGPAILDAVRGCNVVVHLAAVPGDADWMTALLPNNIISTVSLLRAIETVNMDVAEATAAMTGAAPLNRGKRQRTDHTLAPKYPIHRLILGSSGKMYDGHTGNIPITIATPISPICAFGASQAFIEAATKAFSADAIAGCVALSLRFGWCPGTISDMGEMRAASRRDGCGVDEFLSPADAAEAIRVACTTVLQAAAADEEQPRFVTAFVQSKSPPGRYQRFDTSLTLKLLRGRAGPVTVHCCSSCRPLRVRGPACASLSIALLASAKPREHIAARSCHLVSSESCLCHTWSQDGSPRTTLSLALSNRP